MEQARLLLAASDKQGADPESARLDSDLLVQHVTGKSRASLFAFPEATLTPEQLDALDALLQRRCLGEPLAYITGQREFWSLPLQLGEGVLIPRPDTEILVEQALARLSTLPAGGIIELGTGSGAIAVALAQEISDRAIIAVECHTAAIKVAQGNIGRFGNGRVQLVQGSWLDALADDCAAMIISNPPYLANNDPHLPALHYEPLSALVSGQSGLEDLETIISATCRVGRPGCLLLLEHGNEQGDAVRSLLGQYNFKHIQTERDLAGHERVSFGFLTTELAGDTRQE
nr:peptide chain release factor N(5)-glutamine methyltransferase [Granulosicoccus antarcticus]